MRPIDADREIAGLDGMELSLPDPADQQAVRFARITLQQAPTLYPDNANRFGYWKPTKGDAVQCSRCGRRMRRQHSNPKYRDDYCPKCGAYMYLGVDTT